MPAGLLNIYTCTNCLGQIVTIDRVDGTTPFMIGCRVHPDDAKLLSNEDQLTIEQLRSKIDKLKCRGEMYSSFYVVPNPPPKPTWEWYKPTGLEYKRLPKINREQHVDRGGLLLRRIK